MTSRAPLRAVFDIRRILFVLSFTTLLVMHDECIAEDGVKIDEGLSKRVETWKEKLKELKKKDDVAALAKELEKAESLYESAASHRKLRDVIIDALGTSVRGLRGDEPASTMLRTLGHLGDPRGAKYVKPYLRQRDVQEAPPLLDVAVAVAGDLPDKSLVGPLLKIVEKSKHMGILQDAVSSLGKYGALKRKRVQILEALVKAARKCKPGGPPRARGSTETLDGYGDSGGLARDGGPGARWRALSRSVPRALSEMTGIEQSSMADWFLLAKENKGRLGRLFPKNEGE